MGKSKVRSFGIGLINENQEYYAGSYIEGNVFLELSKDMVPVKSINIQLSGMATVLWKEQRGENRNTFKNSEDICALSWTIWKQEGSSQRGACAAGISAGRYEFPFKIQIPPDLALLTSFEGPQGGIRYSVIAGIAKHSETKLEHTILRRINIRNIVNVHIPRLMQPVATRFEQTAVRGTWHSYGSASLSVTISKGGYYPGENIALSVKIENQSTKEVSAIQVLLVQSVIYSGLGLFFRNRKNYSSHNTVQKIEGSGIPAGKTGYWNNGLLPVPNVPPTTDGNHIITFSYAVHVILDFHKASNLSLQIPVSIGSIPFRQQSQPSSAPYPHQNYMPPPYPVASNY